MSSPSKSAGGNPPRLAFYKPPQQKTNMYQFEEKDLARSSVVQQRYQQQKMTSLSSSSSSTTSSTSSTTINQVTEGGPAHLAGLKLGDTVTKINQVETKTMSLAEANKCVQQSSDELKVSVKQLVAPCNFGSNAIDCRARSFCLPHRHRHVIASRMLCSVRSFEEDEKVSTQERQVVLKAAQSQSIDSDKKANDRG